MPFVLQAAGAVALVGYVSYRYGQHITQGLAIQISDAASQQIVQGLDDVLQEVKAVSQEHQIAMELGMLSWQTPELLKSYAIHQLTLHRHVSQVSFTRGNDVLAVHRLSATDFTVRQRQLKPGELEASKIPVQPPSVVHAVPSLGQESAQPAPQGQWLPLGEPESDEQAQPLMLAYRLPVTDAQGTLPGVVTASVAIPTLAALLQTINLGETGQAFVMDEHGLLVATSTAEALLQTDAEVGAEAVIGTQPLLRSAETSPNPITRTAAAMERSLHGDTAQTSNLTEFRWQHQRYFVRTVPYSLDSQLNWTIVLVVPEVRFLSVIQRNTAMTLALCGATLGLAIAIRLIPTRRRSQPSSQVPLDGDTGDRQDGAPIHPSPETDRPLSWWDYLHAVRLPSKEIHGRKAAELALLARDTHFRQIAEAIAEVVFIKTADNREILYVSPAYERIWGQSCDRLYQQPQAWLDSVHPEDRASTAEFQQSNVTEPRQAEFRIIRPDGSIRWVAEWVAPVFNDVGQVQYLASTVRDISDRKFIEAKRLAAETSLRQSEQRFRAIFNTMFQFMGLLTPSGLLLDINQAALDFGALAQHEVVHKLLWKIRWWSLSTETQAQLKVAVARAAAGEFVRYEVDILGAGDRVVTLDFSLKPLRDDQGKVWLLILEGRDISNRKHIEAALQESEARFQTLAANTPGMLYRYSPDLDGAGTFTYASAGAYELLELEPQQVVQDATTVWNLIHPEDFPSLQASVAVAVQNCAHWQWEGRLTTPSGQLKWIQGRSRPQPTPQGMVWDGLLIDISDRKCAEESLRQSELRYLSIVQDQTELIARFQADGTLVFVNDAFCRYYGLPKERIVGHSYKPRIYPEDQPLIDACLAALSPQNPIGTVEHRVWVNGTMRWTQWTNQVIYDAQGQFIELQSVGRDIHERKQAELALQQSETRFREISDASPANIYILVRRVDGSFYFEHISKASETIQELRVEDILADATVLLNCIHPDDRAGYEAVVQTSLELLQPFQHEWRIITPSGTVKWLKGSSQPKRRENGEIAWYGVALDVTPRKQAEAELRQIQSALLQAQRVAHIGNWEFDLSSQTITWSAELFRMFGLDPDQGEPAYADYLQMIHPDDRVVLQQCVARAAEQGLSYVIDYRAMLPDGSMRYHEGRAEVERDAQGRVVRLFGTALDITDRKQVEQALQASEARFRAVFEQAAVGINQASPSGQFVDANQYFCDLLGYTHEELLALTFQEVTHPMDMEAQRVQLDRLYRGEIDAFSMEKRYRHKHGGWVWTDMTLSLIRDAEGNPIKDLAVVIDIGDRKQAETELKIKTEELNQFFSVALDLLCIATIDGHFLRLNPQWQQTLGYRLEDLEGSRFLDYVHPDDRDSTLEAIAQLANQQEIYGFVNRYRCRDSSYRWLEWRSYPVGNLIYAAARDISDRLQLEQELIKNRDFRELLFNESNDALFLVDADTLLTTDCNQQALNLFEIETKADLIGKEGHILQKQKFTPEELISIKQTIDQRGFWSREVEYVTRRGREFWGDLSVKQITFGDQRFNLVRVADISDRKQAESDLQQLNEKLEQHVHERTQQLSQSEERLRLALMASQQGLYDLNVQTGEAITSPEYAIMLGYDPATFQESLQDWLKRLHPDDVEHVTNTYRAYMSGNIHEYQAEFRQRTKDGRWKWILSIGKLVAWDEYGQPLRMLGIHADISDRKQAEQALKESRNILNLVLNTIPQRVFWKDLESRFLGCNASFANDYHLTVEDIVGKTDMELPWAEGAHLYRADDANIIRTRIPKLNYEEPNRNSNGEKGWIRISKIPLTDSQGAVIGVLGCYDDITNLKQAETALQQLNSELEQRIQERTLDLQQAVQAADAANQAKSAFLANMSHELRTPLNVILGFTQLLRSDRTLQPQQQEYIRIMHRSGDHLLHLINDILDLSKIEANRITLETSGINLIELLQDLRAMFWERAEDKELQFSLELDPNVPRHIIADPNKLRQVLINLLNNAIKFTHQGGVILRVGLQPMSQNDEPRLEDNFGSNTAVSVSALYFEVIDTGVGIATEELNTIFDAFTQARAGHISLEGTGLGLAISRSIATLMGGDLTAVSTLGKGSTFRFSIPLRLASMEEVTSVNKPETVLGLTPGQPTYRVLVVDDQPYNRYLMVSVLSHMGFEVQEAASGTEAIARWHHWQPHLIWMDLRMPDMDGCEVTRRIRADEDAIADPHRPSTRIIALTAQASSDERTRALSAGCNDFVSKPIQIDLMLAKMAEHLGLTYEYDQSDNFGQPLELASPSTNLDPRLLRIMPDEWIAALHQAALFCDDVAACKLLQAIPQDQSDLVDGLSRLLYDYKFEVVVQLTQPQIPDS
ncbi:PAS domain S-box protein [Leptolyngbya sp. AN02str]|uniref:PAS domain S-box protein n=1 Tax=Leptolyngbya sp. AN02str TaxID=3423363 RepID=UPI003D319FF0